MVNGRINEIHEAAAKLFLQQGYSRTQISHIAKAIGVSAGQYTMISQKKRK